MAAFSDPYPAPEGGYPNWAVVASWDATGARQRIASHGHAKQGAIIDAAYACEQKTQITALETETKAKLEKILTADQVTQLKNFRPPMRGGMGGPQQRGGMGRGGNGPQGDDNSMPPGPPPGEGDNNPPPAGDK